MYFFYTSSAKTYTHITCKEKFIERAIHNICYCVAVLANFICVPRNSQKRLLPFLRLSVPLSVCLSAYISLVSNRWIFVKFDNADLKKIFREFEISLQPDKNMVAFT